MKKRGEGGLGSKSGKLACHTSLFYKIILQHDIEMKFLTMLKFNMTLKRSLGSLLGNWTNCHVTQNCLIVCHLVWHCGFHVIFHDLCHVIQVYHVIWHGTPPPQVPNLASKFDILLRNLTFFPKKGGGGVGSETWHSRMP